MFVGVCLRKIGCSNPSILTIAMHIVAVAPLIITIVAWRAAQEASTFFFLRWIQED